MTASPNGFYDLTPEMLILSIFFLLIHIFSFSVCRATEKYEFKNIANIESSQYPDLVDLYRGRSKHDDPEALNNLGAMYLKGLGVSRNEKMAKEYFLDAAKHNFSPAMYHLGLIFYRGLGVNKNLKQARHWFRKAAILGDKEAQFFLGTILASQSDDLNDTEESLKWFRLAAEKGMAEAQYNFAILRRRENKTFDDTSLYWLEIASEKLHFESIAALFKFYSSEQTKKSDLARVMVKIKQLAEKGDERAQHLLGISYYLAKGLQANPREGEFWIREAALAGLASAQKDLIAIYLNSEQPELRARGLAWSKILANKTISEKVDGLSEITSNDTLEAEKKLRAMLHKVSREINLSGTK